MGDGQELSGHRVWGSASPRNSLGVAPKTGAQTFSGPSAITMHGQLTRAVPSNAGAVNCCDQDLLPPQLIDCVTQTEEKPASSCLCKGHSQGLLGLGKSWLRPLQASLIMLGGGRTVTCTHHEDPRPRRSLTQTVSLPHIHACLALKCGNLRAEHKASGPLKYWGPSNLCPAHTSTQLPAPPSFPLAKGSHTPSSPQSSHYAVNQRAGGRSGRYGPWKPIRLV